MTAHRGIAAFALAALASPVLADAVLPINGAFGNDAGCAFFMSGHMENDEVVLITPDTLTTYASACYFEAMTARRSDGAYEVASSCSEEGEEGTFEVAVTVVDRGRDGIFVALSGINEWGPLFPCPGTEALFAPPGTRV